MKLAILVLVILNIISLAFATSTNMPAVIWQGEARKLHKPAHISSCTSTSLVNFVSSQISSTQQPNIIVSFVHPALRTDEFMRHADAYSAQNNGGVFSNLKDIVESNADSITFADCVIADETSFSNGLLSADFGSNVAVTVVYSETKPNTKYNSIQMNEFKNFISTIDLNKVNLVIVMFDNAQTSEELKKTDSSMSEIVSNVQQASSGNYLALFTSDKAVQPEQNANVNVYHSRKTLGFNSVLDVPQNSNNTQTSLYITSDVANGLVVFIFFLFVILIAVYMMGTIKTAEHLTDNIDFEKKTK